MHMHMLDMPPTFFVSSNYAVLHPGFLHARVHPTNYPSSTRTLSIYYNFCAFLRLSRVRAPFAYDTPPHGRTCRRTGTRGCIRNMTFFFLDVINQLGWIFPQAIRGSA